MLRANPGARDALFTHLPALSAKAAEHARSFEAEHLEVDDPVEVLVDELKAYGAGRRERPGLQRSGGFVAPVAGDEGGAEDAAHDARVRERRGRMPAVPG